MTAGLYSYPAAAAFGRMLPKHKIYEHAAPNGAVKEKFVTQLHRITWAYKLAPATTNLKPTLGAPEIQVFHVELKDQDLSEDVLRTIDQAIPFPTVFELHTAGRVKVTAAYKRPAAGTKWSQSAYFGGAWQPDSAPRSPVPVVLDLGSLYAQIIQSILPYPARVGEELSEAIGRIDAIASVERELTALQTRLLNEKQFNRKVELNRYVRANQVQLRELTSPQNPNPRDEQEDKAWKN